VSDEAAGGSRPITSVISVGGSGGRGHGFGTAPVFLASISTILGAIMFLRFGYAVGHLGLGGALLLILLGHLVTVPTALAIAEIATNRRVEGGGEYFIISRSFGTAIGGAIGVSLYLSQAISVAFYMIAFAEAFRPLEGWWERTTLMTFDPRLLSLPATLALMLLMLSKGASLGVKALWVVVSVLGLSLLLFFLGEPLPSAQGAEVSFFGGIGGADPFILVFAICFPAFTGMTAGVGLSGDLANPRRSIPLGIITATAVGIAVYVALVVKLSLSASPEELASDQLIMARIALWGPVIPIGLACATLSSAIGSMLVAPRTLQALSVDGGLPLPRVNRFLAQGEGSENEPRHGTVVTSVIAVAFVASGNVDFVARIISMFFMVTYGALCLISFLEHFAARPSYRPSFPSRWWMSLVGAVMSFLLMLQMDPIYALLAILVMAGLYRTIVTTRRDSTDDLATIMRGVMTQLTRTLQTTLQKRRLRGESADWRPSLIAVNGRSFDRAAPLQLMAWLCHRQGFGTYLHYVEGRLDADSFAASREALDRLLVDARHRAQGVYVNTMVSPSIRTALAQAIQFPGVSGMDNNTVLFELSRHDGPEVLAEVVEGCRMAAAVRMNAVVLRHTDHFFGNRSLIHVWLTWHDFANVNLMILLSYILAGHPNWRRAEISVFAAFPEAQVAAERARLETMIATGRLPISLANLVIIPTDDRSDFNRLVEERSAGADLTIMGFTAARLEAKGGELLLRHAGLRDVLFVSSQEHILIE